MNELEERLLEGLEHDEYGLTEGDEQLNAEILNHKMDYLTVCVYSLINLCRSQRGTSEEARLRCEREILRAFDRNVEMTTVSLEQYKKRKAQQQTNK